MMRIVVVVPVCSSYCSGGSSRAGSSSHDSLIALAKISIEIAVTVTMVVVMTLNPIVGVVVEIAVAVVTPVAAAQELCGVWC